MSFIEEIAKEQIENIPLNAEGFILEEGKIIGCCKRFDDIDLSANHCPQGYIINLYTCKRCRHFRVIS